MRRIASVLPHVCLLLLITVSVCMAADADPTAAKAPAGKSLLGLVIEAGPIEYILMVLSVVAYSLGLQWIFTIKKETLIPVGLADQLHGIFAEGVTPDSIESARNAVAGDSSMLGNIYAAAFDKADFGYETMKETADTVGTAEHSKYMGKVGWLSLFASSATLLGLLGTVTGIIFSFLKMAANPGGVDANMLSAEIGQALVCTATGLSIAIGVLYIFFALRQRVNGAAVDAAVLTNEVLDYFKNVK